MTSILSSDTLYDRFSIGARFFVSIISIYRPSTAEIDRDLNPTTRPVTSPLCFGENHSHISCRAPRNMIEVPIEPQTPCTTTNPHVWLTTINAKEPVIRHMHPRQITALMCIFPIIRAAMGVKMAVIRELMKKSHTSILGLTTYSSI